MKKLIFSMLALFSVAFIFTSCGDDDSEPIKLPDDGLLEGSIEHPYTVADALSIVKGLTWTNSTKYETTDVVYVKGKISRIASKGTFTEGGTFGNASFYISEDGTEYSGEFFCYRILYFDNKKFKSGQTDIKVGDDVVVCGKLMNYKNNTPQTVPDEAYLISLNGETDGGIGYGSSDNSVYFGTNSATLMWNAATDATYGTGFSATEHGLNIGFYKHTSTSNLVAPNANHIRIYKNSVFSIASTEGRKIKKIVIKCAPDAGTTCYCYDMTGLEGAANAVADHSALTITWTGSAKKIVLQSNNGQVRMEEITVDFE